MIVYQIHGNTQDTTPANPAQGVSEAVNYLRDAVTVKLPESEIIRRAELVVAAIGAGGQAVADARYPSVFYSKDRTSRVLVAQYQGRDYITVGIHHDNAPHVWHGVELPPEEALQFALHILSKPHVSAL